jgi:hypothetical protein
VLTKPTNPSEVDLSFLWYEEVLLTEIGGRVPKIWAAGRRAPPAIAKRLRKDIAVKQAVLAHLRANYKQEEDLPKGHTKMIADRFKVRERMVKDLKKQWRRDGLALRKLLSLQPVSPSGKRRYQVKTSPIQDLEELLYDWFLSKFMPEMKRGATVKKSTLEKQAFFFRAQLLKDYRREETKLKEGNQTAKTQSQLNRCRATLVALQDFTFSDTWFNNWKQDHRVRWIRFLGDSLGQNRAWVASSRENTQRAVVLYGVANIKFCHNADETALSTVRGEHGYSPCKTEVIKYVFGGDATAFPNRRSIPGTAALHAKVFVFLDSIAVLVW